MHHTNYYITETLTDYLQIDLHVKKNLESLAHAYAIWVSSLKSMVKLRYTVHITEIPEITKQDGIIEC
ncbi:hypothetical protein MBAV_005023 [Candidatus Magnetobacterium bavaricum]|uniref:Uncharacterized protein n=1 Tax=Candidatus Magnetobacterium bavaricum TaxID=29290 RepID=A0A0F3GLG5_9BACT|nr:hypothetical protein MBAV_005023 [Candidatus Magnetobacterium bavaricum]